MLWLSTGEAQTRGITSLIGGAVQRASSGCVHRTLVCIQSQSAKFWNQQHTCYFTAERIQLHQTLKNNQKLSVIITRLMGA